MRQNKIVRYLTRLKLGYYIALFLFMTFITYQITYFFPVDALRNDKVDSLKTIVDNIAFGIILVPIIETLIFQTLIVSVICHLIIRPRHNFYPAIFISAFAFSLNHSYSFYYMFMTFLAGIILAVAFYIARYRKFDATLTVILIHSIWNLAVYLTDNM